MEPLQGLTRRQLEVLETVGRWRGSGSGAPLQTVARSLGIQPPSALAHLRALEAARLVERRSGKSRLTASGAECLEEYTRHHRVAEQLFAALPMPPEEACRAAREIDLALSHALVERLCAAAGHPSVCPHGEPIRSCGPSPKEDR